MEPQRQRERNFRAHARSFDSGARSRGRGPSTSGYMVAAVAAAAALFFVLWWMLQAQENAWMPAGLAASVVVLVAAFARQVVVRRIWARYILEDRASQDFERTSRSRTTNVRRPPTFSQSEALRVLESEVSRCE